MTRPVCPKCGTVAVEKAGKGRLRCREADCGHEGPRATFRQDHWGSAHQPNEHWRDPVALLPGGYEDNQ